MQMRGAFRPGATTHWHVDRANGIMYIALGPVGICCNEFASWEEVFGEADE